MTTMTLTENRPTVADYCANCGSTGACKTWRERHGHDCIQPPRPLTLEEHAWVVRKDAIETMTDDERRLTLHWLSGADSKLIDRALGRHQR